GPGRRDQANPPDPLGRQILAALQSLPLFLKKVLYSTKVTLRVPNWAVPAESRNGFHNHLSTAQSLPKSLGQYHPNIIPDFHSQSLANRSACSARKIEKRRVKSEREWRVCALTTLVLPRI